MTTRYSRSLSLLLAILAAACGSSPNPPRPDHDPAEPEEPGARDRYEWMTLHDPATGVIPVDMRRREQRHAAQMRAVEQKGGRSLQSEVAWTARGPWNIGGRTRALAIDMSDTTTLLAGGVTGGMWRRDPATMTWTSTSDPLAMPSVTCVAQDLRPGRMERWYYGTGEYRTNSTRFGGAWWLGDGIYRSDDSGKSWTLLPSTVSSTPQSADSPFDFVNAIVVDRFTQSADVVYAAAYNGIMRSDDGGGSWHRVLTADSLSPTGWTNLMQSPDGRLLAGFGGRRLAQGSSVRSGLYISSDGLAWTSITPPDWPDSVRRIVFDVAPSDPTRIYVAAETPGVGFQINGSYGYPEHYSLWVSTDGGASWSNRSQNFPRLNDMSWIFNTLNSYCFAVRVDLLDPSRVYLACNNLYVTTDGFATESSYRWLGGYDNDGQYIYENALHPDQHAVVPTPDGGLLIGNDGGVYYATREQLESGAESVSWVPFNDGYITSQFYTIALDPKTPGSTLLVAGAQDNGTFSGESPDPRAVWSSDFGGDGSFCAIDSGGNLRYVSSQGGNLWRLRFEPSTTLPYAYANITPAQNQGRHFIHPFELDPDHPETMYYPTGRTLLRCGDLNLIPDGSYDATTIGWNSVGVVPPGKGNISAIGITTGLPKRVYAGTTAGNLYRLDDADGTSPVLLDITDLAMPRNAWINSISVDPADPDRVALVFTNYGVVSIWMSEDGGEQWKPIAGNLEENPDGSGSGPSCRWIAWLRAKNDLLPRLLVGTTTGLYMAESFDGMNTVWSQLGAGSIGAQRVDMIRTRSSDGMVAVATWGRGLFTATFDRLSGVERMASDGGIGLTVTGNAGRSPVAAVSLTTSATVRLQLIDTRGRRVGDVAEGRYDAGTHRLPIETRGLGAGNYTLLLQAGETRLTERIVVAR